jgi:hypothetical protein
MMGLALGLGLGTASGPASAARACGSWSVFASPSLNEQITELSSVAAVSASDVWAVGFHELSYPFDPTQTLAEHWDGTVWSIVSTPNSGPGSNSLMGATAIASSDVWAVGLRTDAIGNVLTLAEHWDGFTWSIVSTPTPGGTSAALTAVAAVSSRDVWAVGYAYTGSASKVLTEHWDGAVWRLVADPVPPVPKNILTGVDTIGTPNVVAVGVSDYLPMPLAEHWNGRRWAPMETQSIGSDPTFQAVAAIAPSDVWAAGYTLAGSDRSRSYRTLAEHWDGTAFSVVATPNVGTNSFFYGIDAVSPSSVWAVGRGEDPTGTVDQTLIERWNGSSWSVVPSPNVGAASNDLSGVSALSGGEAWAVGSFVDPGTGHTDTLVEHFCPA